MNFGENPTFDAIFSLGSGTDYHLLDNFLISWNLEVELISWLDLIDSNELIEKEF